MLPSRPRGTNPEKTLRPFSGEAVLFRSTFFIFAHGLKYCFSLAPGSKYKRFGKRLSGRCRESAGGSSVRLNPGGTLPFSFEKLATLLRENSRNLQNPNL